MQRFISAELNYPDATTASASGSSARIITEIYSIKMLEVLYQ